MASGTPDRGRRGVGGHPLPLGGRRARTVDPDELAGEAQLRARLAELDGTGLRVPGSPAHDRTVDLLAERLAAAGVQDVRTEPVPVVHWEARSWSLTVESGPGGVTGDDVACASCIPYTAGTGPGGVAGRLVAVDVAAPPAPRSLAGCVALFDVPVPPLTLGMVAALGHPGGDPGPPVDPDAPYRRPWVAVTAVVALLDALAGAGAVGAVGVLPLPADGAAGAWFPYDGVVRPVPGVYVDRAAGARLHAVAASGGQVRLALRASATSTTSPNLLGDVPGATDGTVLLNSHTDGTNGVEDNGPDTIVAMARYLARIPRHERPRGVAVSLTTGHFHGGAGQVDFVDRHRGGALGRAACGLTVEHLGALAWEEGPGDAMAATGHPELGVWFVPAIRPLVTACRGMLAAVGAAPAMVLRPFVPVAGSPDGHGWPGEGTQLWTDGHLPTANFITGPTYLLSAVRAADWCDVALWRRQLVALTQMVLDLARVPVADLRRLEDAGPLPTAPP